MLPHGYILATPPTTSSCALPGHDPVPRREKAAICPDRKTSHALGYGSFRLNSFIVVGVYYWTTVVWKELLPDSSLSHLDYESRSYDLGLQGTSMSGICYDIAKQY